MRQAILRQRSSISGLNEPFTIPAVDGSGAEKTVIGHNRRGYRLHLKPPKKAPPKTLGEAYYILEVTLSIGHLKQTKLKMV